jgi:polyadenylate-binding protein
LDGFAKKKQKKNFFLRLLLGIYRYVGHYIPNKDRHSRNQGIQFTNVYVKNLAPDVTEDDLVTLFGKFGTITSTHVERDHTNMSRGFGFVNFENYEEAAESVERLTETEFHGQQLYVSRAQKKGEREEELRRQYEQARQEKVAKYQGVNLYVKNLEDTVDDDALCNEFSPFGTITSAKVMRDEKTGTSRCFGFVCFSTPEEAIHAVAEMNGRMIGSKPIYVAPAQRKEARRSQLEVQMSQRGQMRPPMNPGFGGGAPPMFYGNHPQGFNGQRPMYAPNNMMARPRWAPVQQQGFPNQGYPMYQRPPREPRPPRATNKAPSEEQASGNDFDGPASSTASALASVPPEAQKQVLGERLYPIV